MESLTLAKVVSKKTIRDRFTDAWPWNDPRRAELIRRRPATADDVAAWARDIRNGPHGQNGRNGKNGKEDASGS